MKIEIYCDHCHYLFKIPESKYLTNKSGLHFCSRECKSEASSLGNPLTNALSINATGASYRSHALRVQDNRCNTCGYSKDIRMLDIDHIDSDRQNNSIENLQVLCVWCHALKTRNVEYHERI